MLQVVEKLDNGSEVFRLFLFEESGAKVIAWDQPITSTILFGSVCKVAQMTMFRNTFGHGSSLRLLALFHHFLLPFAIWLALVSLLQTAFGLI